MKPLYEVFLGNDSVAMCDTRKAADHAVALIELKCGLPADVRVIPSGSPIVCKALNVVQIGGDTYYLGEDSRSKNMEYGD
jgi:hypothetical protein